MLKKMFASSGAHKTNDSQQDSQLPSNNNVMTADKKHISLGKRSKRRLQLVVGRIQSSVSLHSNKSSGSNSSANSASKPAQASIGEPNDNNNNLFDDEYFSSSDYEDASSETGNAVVVAEHEAMKNANSNYLLPEEQCDIPTFLYSKNCDQQLISETRRLLKERFTKNPDNFYEHDYQRMLTDDWTVTRFLLRRRLDPKRTAKLMEECGRFRKQYKMSEVKLWEFPIEFHKAGGLFKYAPDRVGNITVYMRVKMYRRVPEISDVFKAFILCILEECDLANGGRGVAVIFDLSSCGLQNVDLSFLSWLLSSFRNYCPKGVSYILVYNLPWILNATCKLAMTWMSESNRRALRFVHGDEIEQFIAPENLPDYLGGMCKINYRQIPEGSRPAIEVCERLDLTREQALKIRELFKEYLDDNEQELANQPTGVDSGSISSAQLVSQASKFIA